MEGWRGQPDDIVGRTVIKSWWVSEDDLGAGPFRWRVFWDVYVDVSPSTARVTVLKGPVIKGDIEWRLVEAEDVKGWVAARYLVVTYD